MRCFMFHTNKLQYRILRVRFRPSHQRSGSDHISHLSFRILLLDGGGRCVAFRRVSRSKKQFGAKPLRSGYKNRARNDFKFER